MFHSSEAVTMNNNKTRLYPEDQRRVDDFLHKGTNKTERHAFKPLKLMLWLAVVIIVFGLISRIIGLFIIPS